MDFAKRKVDARMCDAYVSWVTMTGRSEQGRPKRFLLRLMGLALACPSKILVLARVLHPSIDA
jgi:hypothetical protein